ncbi:UNVERIFIED_CONTAM: phosphotransferase system enzyme I (PtsI) [Acetivibrio alkalicellulosi]
MSRKTFIGKSISTGTGMGNLFVIQDYELNINNDIVELSQIENEITALEVAVCKTFIEIHDLKDGFKGILSEEENRIFEFYKEVLDDRTFFEEMRNTIKEKRYSATKAIYTCIQKYIDDLTQSNDEYIKLRIYDLNDIRKRLIKNMYDECETNIGKINSNHIAVVKELTPIIAATLSKKNVKGVVAQEGAGYYSHGSIILRSSGIPTIGDISFEKLANEEDSFSIIDCTSNILVVEPEELEVLNYKSTINYHINNKEIENRGPVSTKDGHAVGIHANISNVRDFSIAKTINIDGIGLVRTEALFINYKKIPDEKRQFLIYSKIAKDMAGKPVVIRTADVGGDKVPESLGINSESLKRSSRGIKRSLEQKSEFMIQLKSIIRAAEFGDVRVSFPMVSNVQEIREVKDIINKLTEDLILNNKEVKKIKIGALIETASAVEQLDEILKEVDFISIGTNDLLHQICNYNRKCSPLEKRTYLEPELLRKIKYCIDRAIHINKKVSVCGEMAADLEAAVILIGMGVHELSLNPVSCSNISKFIRSINFNEAKKLAKDVIECSSIEGVKDILAHWMCSGM